MKYTLNPKLQQCLIKKMGWKGLREIQEKSIFPISERKNTLIVSGTASGKTEAALIPIINNMLNTRSSGLKVLYFVPLKALINDLNSRISKLCASLGIRSSPWHGDVDYNEKYKSLDETNILIITPESLEGLLTSRKISPKELFKKVDYMIVDEIHYFAASPRGYQLISLINRISRYSDSMPVKIGLSATVENKDEILKFLCNSDDELNSVVISENKDINREIKVVESEDQLSLESIIERCVQNDPNKKILVFSNSRSNAEKFANALSEKKVAAEVHHASVGKEIRKTVEKSFKNNKLQVVVATSTLELGIDIGDIDQIFFLDVPNSTSSFLQRFGRSGRKDLNPKCWIRFDKSRNIDVLKLLAIHYMLENDLVESIKLYKYCPQIFAHQLISFVYENESISSTDLTEFLNVFCFQKFKEPKKLPLLFKYLVDKDYIYKTGSNYSASSELLNIMEKPLNKMNFVGVFSSSSEYSVEYKGILIGSISYFMYERVKENQKKNKTSEFRLANKAWKVTGVNDARKRIYVESSNKKNIPVWFSKGESITFDFAQAMKEKLSQKFEDVDSYLCLMRISSFSKEYISSVVMEEKQILDFSEILSVSSLQVGNYISEVIYTYFGENGNYFLKCILELCDFEVDTHNFRVLKIKSNTGILKSKKLEEYVFCDEETLKSRLLEYFCQNIKIVENVYVLFGDRLGKYIPNVLKADFVVEYLYDDRIISVLKNFFRRQNDK
jgi:ATP-dependent Lhr-like helicase